MALKPRSQAGMVAAAVMGDKVADAELSRGVTEGLAAERARTEPGFRPESPPAGATANITHVDVTVVEVTWGDEFYQPVPFNGFHVGPFKASAVVQEGQTVEQVGSTVYRMLDRLARAVYEEKSSDYLARLKQLAVKVDRS